MEENNYKEKIAFLKSYKGLNDKLTYLNNRIANVQGIRYDDSSGGTTHKTINELIDEKTEVIEKMNEIENVINNIAEVYERLVLGYRYLQLFSVSKTASVMNKSETWIKQKTKESINNLKIKTESVCYCP